MADATVLFTPSGSTSGGVVATGRTDSQGKFKLTTTTPGDGAVPGDYIVSVTPDVAPQAEGDYSAPSEPPFPVLYTSASGSTLKATVKTGGGNDFSLSLE